MKALLIASLLLPVAAMAATEYTIDFTTSGGTTPSSGSFTYDPISGFSDFIVVYDGVSFDLTSAANAPTTGGTGCDSEASTPQFGFIIMSETATGCASPTYGWSAGTGSGFGIFQFNLDDNAAGDNVTKTLSTGAAGSGGNGSWSITASVPEPRYSLLLLAGVLAMAGFRSNWRRQ